VVCSLVCIRVKQLKLTDNIMPVARIVYHRLQDSIGHCDRHLTHEESTQYLEVLQCLRGARNTVILTS